VTKKLLTAIDKDMSPERYLLKQLKKNGMLSETKLNAEMRLKFKLLYVPDSRLVDTIRAL